MERKGKEQVGRPQLMTEMVRSRIIEILRGEPKSTVKELHGDLRKYLSQKLKNKYPDLTAKEIIEIVEPPEKKDNSEEVELSDYRGYQLPGESAIAKWLKEDNVKEGIIEQLKQPGELDREWNIGASACIKYGLPIPAEMIPLLIEINEKEKEPYILDLPHFPPYKDNGKPLTLRLARWIAYLYPIAKKSKPILEYVKKCNPETEITESLPFKGIVGIMAEMYAKREQIAEIMHQPFADTSDLDAVFSSSSEVDLVKLWVKTFIPEEYKKAREAYKEFRPFPLIVWTSTLRINGLTQEQADLLNEWVKNEYFSQIEPHKSGEIEKELLSKHPELQALIDIYNKNNDEYIEMKLKERGESNG